MNYDEFLDALASGDGRYLESPEGHGWLPPRRVCPESGSTDLSPAALPEEGEIVALTQVHVPAPDFADDAPYCTAIVDFGPVRVTGVLQGVEYETVAIGDTVTAGVGRSETTDERIVVFEPV